MHETDVKLNKQGVYGETTVSPYRVRIRKATLLESRRLSSQSFVYYVPYIPLRFLPQLPDPLSEYCFDKNTDLEVVYWELDYQLCPSLATGDLSTSVVFGIRPDVADDVFNFVNGIVLEDQATRTVVRMLLDKIKIIEPTISRSQSMEKLLANQLELVVFGLQIPNARYALRPDGEFKQLQVAKLPEGDISLKHLLHRYWTRGEICL